MYGWLAFGVLVLIILALVVGVVIYFIQNPLVR